MTGYAACFLTCVISVFVLSVSGDPSFRRLGLVNYGLHPFRVTSRPVRITNGVIVGTSDGKTEAFMGIPYALPPVGSRRFMRPESIIDERWSETRSAKKTGPMCVQRSAFFEVTPVVGNEDCLHLNVYRPTATAFPGSNLPVMVFIHGGAFTVGSGYWMDGQFDGSNLALDENVIVVVMNYRMNLFGFLATPELQAANGGTVGNIGLQDQQESLRWVKREVEKFGGDSDNITLFGESAGGFSVVWHAVNEHSKVEGLFHKAIAQSATTDLSWFFQSKEDAFQLYLAFSNFLHCDNLACLQNIPAHDLLRAWTEWSASIFSNLAKESDHSHHPELIPLLHLLCAFGPVIDGHRDGLLDLPRNLIKAGAFHRVPLMAGITRDEGSLFALVIPLIVGASEQTPMTVDQWMEILELVLQKPDAIAEMYALYPLKKIHGIWGAQIWAMELIRDACFGCSTEELVVDWQLHLQDAMSERTSSSESLTDSDSDMWLHVDHANSVAVETPNLSDANLSSMEPTSLSTYLYLFSATLGPIGKYTGMGSMHSFDLHYIFKNFPMGYSWIGGSREGAIANEMSSRWAQFARTGDPNPFTAKIRWQPYLATNQILEFGYPEEERTMTEMAVNWIGSWLGRKSNDEPPSRLVDRFTATKEQWPEEHKCEFWKRQIPLPWIPHKKGKIF